MLSTIGAAAVAVSAALGAPGALGDELQVDGSPLGAGDRIEGDLADGTTAHISYGSGDINCAESIPASELIATIDSAGGTGVNPVLEIAAVGWFLGDSDGSGGQRADVCTDTIFGVDFTHMKSKSAVDGTVSTTAGAQPDGQVTFASQTIAWDWYSTAGYVCTYKNDGTLTAALDGAAQTLEIANAPLTRTAGSSCVTSVELSVTYDLTRPDAPGTLGVSDS